MFTRDRVMALQGNETMDSWLCFILVASLYIYAEALMFNGRPDGGKVGAPEVLEGTLLPDEQFYEFQKVNHFDGSDFRTWKQRYFVNDAAFREGGPIFLMLGGVGEANPAWLVDGAWQQYARDHGAFLVLLEHRYYGKSQPVSDISTPNLQYLNSKKALADIAQFIIFFKSLYIYRNLQNSSLILFGGSYGGSLAAWAKSHYPYLVQGAVASSAPMVALMEFRAYFDKVSDALDITGSKCRLAVQNATLQLFDWWGQSDKYRALQNMFRLCDKINHDNVLDMSVLFYNLAENFAGVVQYNNVNRTFLDIKGSDLTIQTVCDIMIDENRGDSLQRYADVNSLILDTYEEQCLNLRYSKLAHSLNQTSWNSISAKGNRQWLYQTCSEVGWMQTSFTTYKSTFGPWYLFPSNFTIALCNDVFKLPIDWMRSETTNNCDETNRFYGGLRLPISNTIFVNGMLDPWRSVSILSKPPGTSDDVTVFLINGTSHCADMYPPSPNDPSQLTETRYQISKLIGTWL